MIGKSAAGKDHARKICQQWLNMEYQVSYTTRPPRKHEIDGQDYFFISNEQFNDKIDAEEWHEFVSFNGWHYGTTKEQFYTKNSVFIMTPSGLNCMEEIDRNESLVVYLDIDEDIRRKRIMERNESDDSLERRILADRKDFANFKNYDIKVTEPLFSIKYFCETVLGNLSTKILQDSRLS